MENHFFELPVYRCSEVIYSKELDELQKRIDLQVPYLKGQEKETEVIKTDLFYRFHMDMHIIKLLDGFNYMF